MLGKDRTGEKLFRTIARCLRSPHFQVAERALLLWNCEVLTNDGILSKPLAHLSLPHVLPALIANSNEHWNPTVHGLSENVIRMYQTWDGVSYDKALKRIKEEEQRREMQREKNASRWRDLLSSS